MIWMLLSFAAGALLGAIFFGGLWWTVNNLTGSRRPALLIVASFLVRTAAVLAGFYLILRSDQEGWQRLLAALGGFIVVRMAALFLARPAKTALPGKEGGPQDEH